MPCDLKFTVPPNLEAWAIRASVDEFIAAGATIAPQLYTPARGMFNAVNIYIIINTRILMASILEICTLDICMDSIKTQTSAYSDDSHNFLLIEC